MSEQPGQSDGGTGPRSEGGQGVGTPDRPQPERDARPPAYKQPPGGLPPGPADGAARRALWLGVGGLVVTVFFWPLGLVLDIAAIVVGIRALRAAKARHQRAPGATGGIVAGAVGAVLAAGALTVTIIVWPETNALRECLDTANTVTDEKVCEDKYVPEIEKKLGVPPGSIPWFTETL